MSVSASISVNISMVSVHSNRFIFQCGSAHPGSVLVSVEVLIHDGRKFSQRYIEWRITTILCILCYYIIPKKRNTEWTIWTSCNFPKYVALNSCTAADDWGFEIHCCNFKKWTCKTLMICHISIVLTGDWCVTVWAILLKKIYIFL